MVKQCRVKLRGSPSTTLKSEDMGNVRHLDANIAGARILDVSP